MGALFSSPKKPDPPLEPEPDRSEALRRKFLADSRRPGQSLISRLGNIGSASIRSSGLSAGGGRVGLG